MSFIKLFFGFRGRASRGQYWLGAGVTGLLGMMMVWFGLVGLKNLGVDVTAPGYRLGFADIAKLGPMAIPVMFAFVTSVWITTAISVKRLHDRNKGWVWAVAYLIPGWIAYFVPQVPALQILALLVGAASFYEFAFGASVNDGNRFDDDDATEAEADLQFANHEFTSAPTRQPKKTAPNWSNQIMQQDTQSDDMPVKVTRPRAPASTPSYQPVPNYGAPRTQSFGRLNNTGNAGFGRRGV
jgi:uncharacterized membrane protein YhaH (DUF805 family)